MDKSKGTPIGNDLRVVHRKLGNGGLRTPIQDKIYFYVKDHPNCTIQELYKVIPNTDLAHVRTAIRKMVEGHKIRQRFTVN